MDRYLQIKFRAWDTDRKIMYANDLNYMFWSHIGSWEHTPIVMQYTGLKDKSGREVYENDIIKLDKEWTEMIGAGRENCLVGFEEGAFMFGRSDIDPLYMDSYLWMSANKAKVIGNIYENPKLLENKEESVN